MIFRKQSKSDVFTGFLDHGTTLTGELHFSGTFRVDGNVHGTIKTADILIVGERGSIHADIEAGEVRIHGAVYGNVEGRRRVEILSTGRLTGEVRTPRFIVEEGGSFEGRSQHTASSSDADAIETAEAEKSTPSHAEKRAG